MSQAEEAFDLVRERGEMRSSAIAERLGCTPANVHELLLPHVQRGALVSCDVEIYGERLKDYRVSAAGGGETKEFRPYRSTPEQKKPPTFPTATPPKEITAVTVSDKCEAAFKKHGPMTTRALRAHVKDGHVSTIVAQCARAGRFAVLGGGRRNTIFGLPGQKLSDVAPDAPSADKTPRSVHKKRAGGGKGMRRKQRKQRDVEILLLPAAAKRRIEVARQVITAFRPAIACDGALLLTGATRPGELDKDETRVLAEFLSRVDRTGALA